MHSYELNSKLSKKPKPAQTSPNSTFCFVKKKQTRRTFFEGLWIGHVTKTFLWATISIILKCIYTMTSDSIQKE